MCRSIESSFLFRFNCCTSFPPPSFYSAVWRTSCPCPCLVFLSGLSCASYICIWLPFLPYAHYMWLPWFISLLFLGFSFLNPFLAIYILRPDSHTCFFFPSVYLAMSLFPSIFCTITVFPMYGEYVVRSFLPDGVLYISLCKNSINQSINQPSTTIGFCWYYADVRPKPKIRPILDLKNFGFLAPQESVYIYIWLRSDFA